MSCRSLVTLLYLPEKPVNVFQFLVFKVQKNFPEDMGFLFCLNRKMPNVERKIVSLVTTFPPTRSTLPLKMADYFSLMADSPKKSSLAQSLILTMQWQGLLEQTCLAPISGTSSAFQTSGKKSVVQLSELPFLLKSASAGMRGSNSLIPTDAAEQQGAAPSVETIQNQTFLQSQISELLLYNQCKLPKKRLCFY